MLLAMRSQWLQVFVAVFLLALAVTAQDANTNTNNNNGGTTPTTTDNTSNNNDNNVPAVPNAAELASSASAASAAESAASSSSEESTSSDEETSSSSEAETKTKSQGASITATDNGATTTDAGDAPTISNTATATNDAPGGTLPAVSGVITQVTPTVPPTADAPFMRQSSLPEGTVFIIVGAILGFLGMSVLFWRAIVAWSLRRSVRGLGSQHPMADDKKLAIPAPFYSQYRDQASTISLGPGGAGGKHGKKNYKQPDFAAPSTSTLFFSPTAAGASMSAVSSAGNRSSSYLPSGYYGGPATGSQTHLGMGGNAINMSTLRPDTGRDSQRMSKATSWAGMGSSASPPDSPAQRASMAGTGMKSSSTLNLSLPPGDHRTPSLCLDDLLDGEGGVLNPNVQGTGPGGIGTGHWREHERRPTSSHLGPNGGRRPSTGTGASVRPGTGTSRLSRSEERR